MALLHKDDKHPLRFQLAEPKMVTTSGPRHCVIDTATRIGPDEVPVVVGTFYDLQNATDEANKRNAEHDGEVLLHADGTIRYPPA